MNSTRPGLNLLYRLCQKPPASIIIKRCFHLTVQLARKKPETNVSALFKPVIVRPDLGSENDVGAELVGKLDKAEVLKILNKFTQKREIKGLCAENGLDGKYKVISWEIFNLIMAILSISAATSICFLQEVLH